MMRSIFLDITRIHTLIRQSIIRITGTSSHYLLRISNQAMQTPLLIFAKDHISLLWWQRVGCSLVQEKLSCRQLVPTRRSPESSQRFKLAKNLKYCRYGAAEPKTHIWLSLRCKILKLWRSIWCQQVKTLMVCLAKATMNQLALPLRSLTMIIHQSSLQKFPC